MPETASGKVRPSPLPWLALGVFLTASVALKQGAAVQAPEPEPVFSRPLLPWLAGGMVWTAPRLIPLLMPDGPLMKDRR